MNSFESLIRNLSGVRNYSFREGTVNFAEISAVGAGLDLVFREIDTLLREGFLCTAQSYGLSKVEETFGKERSDLPNTTRREMLVARSLLNCNDFTREGVKRILAALGATGRLGESATTGSLVIYIGDRGFTEGEKSFIRSQLSVLLPAHITPEIFFSSMNWQSIEERNVTFSSIEAKNYTWEYIDSM